MPDLDQGLTDTAAIESSQEGGPESDSKEGITDNSTTEED